MRETRYFVRVTPTNYLYALALSLRHPVAVWKVAVPNFFARRFERLRPYRIFTRDEWVLAHDATFERWKRAFPIVSERHRARASLGGRQVDFSHNLWQVLGIEFEALSLLTAMLQKTRTGAAPPCVVAPRIAGAFEAAELEALFPHVRFARSGTHRLLENLHEWALAAAHLGRTLLFAAASFFHRRLDVGHRPVAWLGVSPAEIPDRDERLNFAWATQYGILDPRDVLYFLPVAPAPSQRAYLDAHGTRALAPSRMFTVLSSRATLAVTARSIAGFFQSLAAGPTAAPFLARFMASAPYWQRLFADLGTRAYVTTTSYAWPEKPEPAVAAAAGLRSIIWAYSANALTFSIAQPGFRDISVMRSIIATKEFWVWSQAYARWLEQRQVDADRAPTIRVVGPLMCGDPRLLRLDARAARARLGISPGGVCIGVFDMPPISDAWRDRYGGGPPMIDQDMYVAFWTLIERIVERVPEAVALIKMKRGFSHQYREFPPIVRAFLDEDSAFVKSGRVHIVDVGIDPYLPIVASDIAFGITYTSPILAARSIGRPAYYLDPLRRANFPPARDYIALTLATEDEAVARVLAAQNGECAPSDANSAVPPAAVFPLDIARDKAFDRGETGA